MKKLYWVAGFFVLVGIFLFVTRLISNGGLKSDFDSLTTGDNGRLLTERGFTPPRGAACALQDLASKLRGLKEKAPLGLVLEIDETLKVIDRRLNEEGGSCPAWPNV